MKVLQNIIIGLALLTGTLLIFIALADAGWGAQPWRSALASWYGPGLYGRPMACGGTLQPWTEGVAHRTLPCGTKLTIRYQGRTVTARVIDRGPYAPPRTFDLAAGTAKRLRFTGVGIIQWRIRR